MSKPDISDYDKSGFDYTKYWIGRQYEDKVEHRLLTQLLPQKGEHFLDIGGSFGRLADVYCPRFQKATILDYSSIALQQAQERAHSAGFTNLTTQQGDAYHLPFTDNTFDGAMMVRVMHHLEKPELVIAEAARVLKPNGTFILEVANKIHAKAVIAALVKGDTTYRNDRSPIQHQTGGTEHGIFYNFHPLAIREILQNNHFSIQHHAAVSYFRVPALKQIVPGSLLATLDLLVQPLGSVLYLGPSVWFQCRLQKL